MPMKTKFASSVFLITIAIVFALQMSLFGQDANQSTERLPLSPNQLSQFDWRSGAGILDYIKDWMDYAGKQDYIGRTILKEQSISLLNTKFVAEFRVIKDKQTFEMVTIPSDPLNQARELVTGFALVVKESFGNPDMTIDFSHNLDNKSETLDVTSDWIFGTTRARLSYKGIKYEGKWVLGLCSLQITDRKILGDLQRPIYLKLSGQKRLVGFGGDAKEDRMEPSLFVVDLDDKRILTREYGFLCKLKEVTDDFLIGEWQQDEYDHEIRIDRRLGTFSWKARTKKNKNLGLDIWGECEVLVSIPNKKF